MNNVRIDSSFFEKNLTLNIISNENEIISDVKIDEYNDGLKLTFNNINNKYPKETLKKVCEFLFPKTIYMEMNNDNDKQVALDLGFEYLKSDNKCLYFLTKDKYNRKLLRKNKSVKIVSNNETNVCDNHWDGA